MVAILQFICLSLYEILLAYLMGAFGSIKKNKNLYIFLALLPLAVMTMFHSELIGNDSKEYVRFFNLASTHSLGWLLKESRFEPGYILLNFSLSRITDDPQIIFVFVGLYSYFSFGYWIKKYVKSPGILICLFVEMLIFDGWLSILRQTLAITTLFFSYKYILEKRFIPFLFIVLLASSLHNSSLVFLFAYPAINYFKRKNTTFIRKYEFELITFIACLIISISFDFFLSSLIKLFPTYSYYLNGRYTDGEPRIAIILKCIIYFLMLVIPRLLRKKTEIEKNKIDNNATYRLSIINLILMLVANQATILTRLASMYSIYALYDYCKNISYLKINKKYMIILSLSLFALYGAIITILKTPEWQTTYPFIWCWD